MSEYNFRFEQISEWALSLKYFRYIMGEINNPRGFLPATPDDLTVSLKVNSEDDLINILQHLGVPVIKSFSENLDLSLIGNEPFEPVPYFPRLVIPQKPRIAGAEPRIEITSRRLRLSLRVAVLVVIRYLQLDDGIDMGGTLRLEKQSVAGFIDTLLKFVYVYAQPEIVIRCGADDLTIYESGPVRQPCYNVLNRRATETPGGRLSGLMLTRWAAEEIMSKLLALLTKN